MKLNQLVKTSRNSKKRLGRGYGSGKGGHTSGRGQKGQRSRSAIPIWFEGGQLPQIRRFPFIRGKGRFKSLKPAVVEINLSALNQFKPNTEINLNSLVKAGLVKSKELQFKTVKILGRGKIEIPLNISVPTSESARLKIEKAGGKVNREQAS